MLGGVTASLFASTAAMLAVATVSPFADTSRGKMTLVFTTFTTRSRSKGAPSLLSPLPSQVG